MRMSQQPDKNSSSVSREQVTQAYLNAIKLIDKRVTPFLGKATTRVLAQAAAKRLAPTYPFLVLLEKMPYTEIVPAVMGWVRNFENLVGLTGLGLMSSGLGRVELG